MKNETPSLLKDLLFLLTVTSRRMEMGNVSIKPVTIFFLSFQIVAANVTDIDSSFFFSFFLWVSEVSEVYMRPLQSSLPHNASIRDSGLMQPHPFP